MRAWLARLHRGGLTPGTLHHMLSACRSFFNFLARDGAVAANPAAGVHSPKLRRKLPEVLDVDEVGALLEFPPAIRRPCATARFLNFYTRAACASRS
jgi:integrase/recombinase XerC